MSRDIAFIVVLVEPPDSFKHFNMFNFLHEPQMRDAFKTMNSVKPVPQDNMDCISKAIRLTLFSGDL